MKHQTADTRWFSLRRHLLVWLLTGVSAGWLLALFFSYHDAHHEIDELFDAQMVQVAQTLLALASEYDDDIARMETEGHKYQKHFIFQLWDAEGRLLLRSQHAPIVLLTEQDGFSETWHSNGRHWRNYSQWDREKRLRVQVAENHHVRDELSGYIIGQLLLPALFGLPLLGFWLWFATRRGLSPLDAIAAQVAERAPERLDPVIPSRAPLEMRPLLAALNGLFGRLSATLDNERRFTADAAHELRTPLAAILAQSEVAQRARDEIERSQALKQIQTAGRRASRLIDQLLTLARIDPMHLLSLQTLRLDSLAIEVCAEHGAAALDKHIVLELDAPQPVPLRGHEDMLRILLRNLLDNALRYTPAGGKVSLTVTASEGMAVLTVSDNGPGIAPELRLAALRRFHRLASQDSAGSGLGLSIVARIAELHHARLELDNGLPREGGCGLSVKLSFPESLQPQ